MLKVCKMKSTQKIRLTLDGVSIDTCVKNIRKGLCKEESANEATKMCLYSFEMFMLAHDVGFNNVVGHKGFWNGHNVGLDLI
jgi:hypothetical protein